MPALVFDLLCCECGQSRSRRNALIIQFDTPKYFARLNITISNRALFVCKECLDYLYGDGLGYSRWEVEFFIRECGPRNWRAAA